MAWRTITAFRSYMRFADPQLGGLASSAPLLKRTKPHSPAAPVVDGKVTEAETLVNAAAGFGIIRGQKLRTSRPDEMPGDRPKIKNMIAIGCSIPTAQRWHAVHEIHPHSQARGERRTDHQQPTSLPWCQWHGWVASNNSMGSTTTPPVRTPPAGGRGRGLVTASGFIDHAGDLHGQAHRRHQRALRYRPLASTCSTVQAQGQSSR